ncbi:MAG: hypothetical protein Q8N03_03040 [Ignavibacteria bacterium]|nr:hypothetical protein [Ignavibacteria bacterium]
MLHIKKKIIKSACGFIIALLLNSCSTSTITETLYLGNSDVSSPITPPPVHSGFKSGEGDLIITPMIQYNEKRSVGFRTSNPYNKSLLLSDSSIMSVNEKNFQWNFPQYQFGVDVDAALTKSFAFFIGGYYSSLKEFQLLNWNLGFGFYSQKPTGGVRFDFGILFQKYFFDTETIIHSKEVDRNGKIVREDFLYFRDRASKTNYSFFSLLTVHSANKDDLINYGFSFGYFTQELLDFKPGVTNSTLREVSFNSLFENKYKTDLRPESTPGFIILSPMLSLKVYENIRLVLTVKAIKEIRMEQTFDDWLVLPTMQLDFNF